MSRLGVLGGTFNPPHAGHLSAARHAHDQLALARVLLVPVHTPPHKRAEADAGAGHRLAMTRLLADCEPWLEASAVELERGGPSYTVDTLRQLHARDPGADLTLIVGADMARTLPAWREPQEILRLARVAVAERDGAARSEIAAALAGLGCCEPVTGGAEAQGGGGEGRIAFLDMPDVPISSSAVRDRVAAGGEPGELVPAAVARYIAEHALYRSSGGVAAVGGGRADAETAT